MILIALAACNGDKDPHTGETGVVVVEPFEVFADQIAGGTLLGAWSSGDELLMVGGDLNFLGATTGNLVRWDGSSLCVEEGISDTTLWWIHGPAAGEWYAVGAEGRVIHEVGGVRTDESLPTLSTLYGVWAAEDGRVFAAGGDVRGTGLGEIWVREAGVWSPLAIDLPGVVFKVWDRWFVGDGLVLHLEGDLLVAYPPPDDAKLLTVRGRSDGDVWAVGGSSGPVLLHWDGFAWESVEVDLTCTSQPLNGVWTAPGEDVWIAGNTGAMARYDGEQWYCARPPVTFEHFHAVWQHDDEMWWAGGNLFSSGNNYGTIGHFGATTESVSAEPCP